jgi:hypothetical protein
MQTTYFIATLQTAGLPALHVISIIAVMIFAGFGIYIYRNRHRLFDRDPELPDYQDGPAVRHIRVELVLLIWGALMLVMVGLLYQIWRV